MDVAISDDLKSMMAKCKPGQSKTISVKYTMGEGGKVSVSPAEVSEEATEEKVPAPAAKPKKGSRPAPVMDAIAAMY